MSRLLSETYTGTAWYIYAVVSRSFSVFYNVGEACELQNSTSQSTSRELLPVNRYGKPIHIPYSMQRYCFK